MFEILYTYREGFLSGLVTTLWLATIVWTAGLGLGVILGALADRYPDSVGILIKAISFILAAIPVIVLSFWAHFPLQVLLQKVIDPFVTAAAVLTVVNTFAVAQIVAAALGEFPEQYVTAARVCGLDTRTTFLKIKLPIIFRLLLPPLLSAQVVILQATLFASLISVEEVFRAAQRINATAYKPVEIYSAVAILFLIICLPLNGLAAILKQRFSRNLSER
jgi:polar amino acid transport system permease protein